MKDGALLVMDRVSKSYGRTLALNNCSASVARSEVVVICGPSGSGKSTLVRCLNGLEQSDSGSITVDGLVVGDSRTDLRMLRARIGMVFQNFELYSHMTALQNVSLPLLNVLKGRRDDAERRSADLLTRMGVADKLHSWPAQLSVGQQQRVAIARAMAMEPKMMVFDDPTSALDPEAMAGVCEVIRALAHEGVTIIVVTHEMGFARYVAQRVLFLDRGRILEDTPSEAFFVKPQTERARQFLSKVLS